MNDGTPTEADLIGYAAEEHDVVMEHAITATPAQDEADRIYILEDVETGYRLIHFGLDADGNPASPEDPMHIPNEAIPALSGLLHGAVMHQCSDIDAKHWDSPTIREVAEGMGLAEPQSVTDVIDRNHPDGED